MKKIVFFFAMFLISLSVLYAKNLKPEEVKYQEVIEFPGMDADSLYEKAKQGLVNQFHSAKEVIQYADKEQGKIIGKGRTDVTYSFAPVKTWFIVTIDVKNEKLRITFTDMRLPGVFSGKEDETPMNLQMQLDKFSVKAKKFVESLKSEILSSVEEEDW